MKLVPTEEQSRICDEAFDWYYNQPNEQVFQVSGGPGTGKSTLMNMIVDRLAVPRHKIIPMSYIGSASLNMRLKGLTNAKTMHSWIYTPANIFETDTMGNIVLNDYINRPQITQSFVKKKLDGDYSLVIFDEGGSCPSKHRKDILDLGLKIMVFGDIDQIPPVNDTPAFLYDGKIHRLTQIMRQNLNSSIVKLSRRALQGLPIHKGFYGDVLVIDYEDLTDDMIMGSDVVICGRNATRDDINNRVRKNILGINSEIPVYGERMVCRQNNWLIESDGINLVNGLTGIVSNYPDISCFDGKSFKIDFLPNLGYVPFTGIPINYEYLISPYETRRMLKNSKFYNGELFEYAYAITAHCAQGSEYQNGIYIEEYMNPKEQNNINYVGISRFKQSCIYVRKYNKRFF